MKGSKIFLLPIVILCIGCTGGENDSNDGNPHKMYEELCALTKAYTDSMKHVKDSTAFYELSDRYEEKYAAISFKYPVGTDVELSEGENDTLFMLAKAYIKAREKALKVAPADSVAADSVASIKAESKTKAESKPLQ